ncbi:MAG: Xaa-Pro peptidase family protein [Planctomycetota bacterium]
MTKSANDRFSQRRDRLTKTLKKLGVQAFLVSHPVNVSYLTGFSGEDSYLVVSPEKSLLISDGRFTEQIEEECPGLDANIRRTGLTLPGAVGEFAKSSKIMSMAFESNAMTVAGWESLKESCSVEWLGHSGGVEALRMVKDSDEIRQIREAIHVAERAFGILKASLRNESDEKTLADQLDGWIRQLGGKRCAFPSIVAVGSRAALPHAVPTSRQFQEAEFVLVDWGAKGEFYNSDLTRILATRKTSRKLAKVYEVVLRAQRHAIECIRPGVTGDAVDAAARSVIEAAGYGKYFTHSLGHGLGMEVHEAPSLRRGSKTVLCPGMVVTVEPGIYIRGWGGVRIEDDVLVTRDGHEVLSSLPTELEASVIA